MKIMSPKFFFDVVVTTFVDKMYTKYLLQSAYNLIRWITPTSAKIIISVLIFSASPTTEIYAQSGDEQGLDVPKGLDLKEDEIAFQEALSGWWKESKKKYEERMAWYKEAKFGCFIHWGPSSVPAGIWKGKRLMGYTEHLMRRECITLEDYKKELIAPFNPTEFNAEEWMKNAHDAGMKFFIITAKHHDGFAMYHSDAYPYDMRMTAYKGGDFMEELRTAAKKYGIKFGFYYSHAFDWEHPDAPGNDWEHEGRPGGDLNIGGRHWWNTRKDFLPIADKYVVEKSIPQIQELIRKYNPDIMWFDTPHKLPLYQNIRILKAIREMDPQNKIVVNGRLALFADVNLGDYKNTGDRAAFFPKCPGVWEAIPTTNESYGYSAVDTVRKSVPFFIQLLSSAVSKGGNILLNVGPKGNGKWDSRDVSVVKGIGKWLKVNGESIYGTHPSELSIPSWGVTTQKGDTLYAHVYRWPTDKKLVIGGLRSNISKAWFLADKSAAISYKRINADDYELSVPSKAPDENNTVIAMILGNHVKPNKVRLLDHTSSNTLYAFDAHLTGEGMRYGDGKPNRNYVSNWTKDSQWLSWPYRLNKTTSYKVYLDYNTQYSKTDAGTVCVTIGDYTFDVDYTPFTENEGTKSICLGTVNLKKGTSVCTLKGKKHQGSKFMCPIAIRLEK